MSKTLFHLLSVCVCRSGQQISFLQAYRDEELKQHNSGSGCIVCESALIYLYVNMHNNWVVKIFENCCDFILFYIV